MVNGVRNDDYGVGNNNLKSQVQQLESEAVSKTGQKTTENVNGSSSNATFGNAATTARAALEEAGLPVNDRNVGLVRDMLANGMSIDKGSLNRIVTQINMFREADISTLLLMNKNNIPVTHFTAAQLQAYINNEQDLSAQIGDVINTLMELLDSEAATGTSSNMQVLEMLAGNPELSAENMEAMVSGENAVNMAEMVNSGQEGVMSAILTGQGGSEAVYAAGGQQAAAMGDPNAVINMLETTSVNSVVAELGTDAEGSGANWMNGFGADNDSLSSFNEFNTESSNANIGERTMTPQNTEENGSRALLSSFLSENDINELNDLNQKIFGEYSKFDGTETANEVFNEIYRNASEVDEAKLQELFRSGTYQKLVKNALNEKFTLKPSDIDSSDSINRFYKETYSALSKLSDIAGKDAEFADKLSKPMDNMKFMDTLNNVFPYIQLPLKLNEGNTHGELYVFKKGRNKTDPGDTSSVLLHLDMDNLGPTDIHMELKAGFLKLRFYCNDDTSKALLEDNFKGLEEALTGKGFSIGSEFTVRTQDTKTIVDALSGPADTAHEFKYNFDIRA